MTHEISMGYAILIKRNDSWIRAPVLFVLQGRKLVNENMFSLYTCRSNFHKNSYWTKSCAIN